MLLFLYDLPNWLLGLVVTGSAVALILAAYFTFRRLSGAEFTDEERGLAMSVLGVIATVNSLLLAFSAVSVWESFGSAEEAVILEADTIGELARDLAVFESEESTRARGGRWTISIAPSARSILIHRSGRRCCPRSGRERTNCSGIAATVST